MIKEKELNGFQLKLIALIFMLLDHIYYIFEFTGGIPVWFSWLGRISGGLFLFTMVEGYKHTSNKKKYAMRIYSMGIFMGFIRYLFTFIPALQRGDGFYPINGIFQTFTLLIIIFKGMDTFKENKIQGLGIITLPFVLSYLYAVIIQVLPTSMQIKNIIYIVFSLILPSPFMSEGGIFLIISGIILYAFKDNRIKQAIFFFLFHFSWMTILPLIYLKPTSLGLMFTDYYEWIGAFASLFMIFYNGKKGPGMKKLFYIFYPAHIYILYLLSIFTYNILN